MYLGITLGKGKETIWDAADGIQSCCMEIKNLTCWPVALVPGLPFFTDTFIQALGPPGLLLGSFPRLLEAPLEVHNPLTLTEDCGLLP